MRPEHNGYTKVPTPASTSMVPSVFARLTFVLMGALL